MTLTLATALIGWMIVAAGVANLLSQWQRWSRPVAVVVLQSLTRPLLPALAAGAVVAALTDQLLLAVVAASTATATLGFAVAVTRPVAPARSAGRAPTGATLTISHGNIWFANKVARRDPQRLVDALCHADADVVAISEYSHALADAIETTTLPQRYPYRVADPDARGLGSAIFSRRPLVAVDAPRTEPHTTAAVVEGITVLAVHTPSPIANLDEWNVALDEWRHRLPDPERPTVAIGDYNADLFHPALRHTLGGGWRDAHRELGAVVSTSWPTHLLAVPPFVRLDRALVNDAVELIDVGGAALPGSDHRVVTVTVALPTASADAES